jgi:hypothetical protein
VETARIRFLVLDAVLPQMLAGIMIIVDKLKTTPAHHRQIHMVGLGAGRLRRTQEITAKAFFQTSSAEGSRSEMIRVTHLQKKTIRIRHRVQSLARMANICHIQSPGLIPVICRWATGLPRQQR